VELANLTNLQNLYLSANQLQGSIPPELAQLAALKDLRLDQNRFTGSVPDLMAQLPQLRILKIEENAGLCLPQTFLQTEWFNTEIACR
jgi:Leucine-rich repeat (LRR) protein